MRGCHTGYDAEWNEQTVLGAEHELAYTREPSDPGGLIKGMLLDVARCLSTGDVAHLRVVRLRRGATSARAQFIRHKRSRLGCRATDLKAVRIAAMVATGRAYPANASTAADGAVVVPPSTIARLPTRTAAASASG